jgi:hypothetical protein
LIFLAYAILKGNPPHWPYSALQLQDSVLAFWGVSSCFWCVLPENTSSHHEKEAT